MFSKANYQNTKIISQNTDQNVQNNISKTSDVLAFILPVGRGVLCPVLWNHLEATAQPGNRCDNIYS